jgi:hypothetical protein
MKDQILEMSNRELRRQNRLREYAILCVYWTCPTHAMDQLQMVKWEGQKWYEKIEQRSVNPKSNPKSASDYPR